MHINSRLLWIGLLLFLDVGIVSVASGKNTEMKSIPLTEPLSVDGSRADWPKGATVVLDDPAVVVGVCNDSSRMYVLLCFRSPMWAQSVRETGLTLWLDTQGKKHKDFMLRLVGGVPMEQVMAAMEKTPRNEAENMSSNMPERMPQREKETKNRLLFYQKDLMTEKEIPIDGNAGPAVAFSYENNLFVYEFSIPLSKSELLRYGLDAKPGQVISIGYKWGEMDKKGMPEGGPGNGGDMMGGGPPGGGGGGMPPGGPMGGGKFPGGSGTGEQPKAQEIWIKAILSTSEKQKID